MFILFLVTLVDMIGFGIIFPLLPMIKIKFAINDLQLGYLASSFAFFGLIGSIFFGYLSDLIGRKIVLYVPVFLVAIAYVYTAYATTFVELIILRSVCGFLTGNLAVSFASCADLSTPQNKLKNMGIVGAAFGIGFILGPFLGGVTAGNSNDANLVNLYIPFLVASLVSLLSGIIAVLFFKETLLKEERVNDNKQNIVKLVLPLIMNKSFLFFMFLGTLVSIVFAGLEVYFGLWLNTLMSFTPQEIGFYWASFAVAMTVFQMTLNRFLTPKLALVLGFFGLSIALLGILLITNIWFLVVITLLMTMSISVILPSLNTNLSNIGAKNQQGLIFGINQSFGSLGRILGPYVLGILYNINTNFTWIAVAMVCLLGSLLVVRYFKHEEIDNTL